MSRYRTLVAIAELGPGLVCAEDVREPLLAWAGAVKARGGRFKINSLTRTVAEQQPLWQKYNAWIDAGKPANFDEDVMSNVAANQPGRSNHQGGRAVDLSTKNLFPDAPADKQIDLLWETGKPLGWTPIITEPDESQNERWHFDFWGGWRSVKDRYGYTTAAMCAALDVGQAGPWQSNERMVQALLIRAGYEIGDPDGVFGRRSRKALEMAIDGMISDPIEQIAKELRALPPGKRIPVG